MSKYVDGIQSIDPVKDWGWTEDEYSNFILDLFYPPIQLSDNQLKQAASGQTVTITITKDNYNNGKRIAPSN